MFNRFTHVEGVVRHVRCSELDEAEAAVLPGGTVGRDRDVVDGAVSREGATQRLRPGRPRDVLLSERERSQSVEERGIC